jgi:hypothetical protein
MAASSLLSEYGETRSCGNVLQLIASNRARHIRITCRTALRAWKGEVMDDNMAIKAMLRRE